MDRNIENQDKSQALQAETQKGSASWKENPVQAYIDWLNHNLGPEASQRTSLKLIKLMLKAESRWQIAAMRLFRKDNIKLGDSFFDKTRQVIVGTAKGLPKYYFFAEQSSEKQVEIQRWFFATYVEGILNTAKGNSQFDTSMEGIAWSLLAKDARPILKERDQTIDSEWLFKTMGPLIRSNTDKNAIKLELDKFISGDPQVIHTQSIPST